MLLWNPVCFALKTLTVLGKTGSKKLIRLINKSSIETKLCVHTHTHTHVPKQKGVCILDSKRGRGEVCALPGGE